MQGAKAFYYVKTYGPCVYDRTELCLASESTIGAWFEAKTRQALLKKVRTMVKKILMDYPWAWEVKVVKERKGRKIVKIVLIARLRGEDWSGNKYITDEHHHVFEIY